MQGLFAPSMELLSAIDGNSSQVWSFANQPADSNYQAAAMEAILSQASLGLMLPSDYQSLAHYGILHHPAIIEGMDETQIFPSSNPDLSSNSATASPSSGLDHNSLNPYNKHTSKPNNMMLSSPHDFPKGQAGICAVSALKRRSWHEALSSPPRGDHYFPNTGNPTAGEFSPSEAHILNYSVNDPEASIASLAYPCTIVERTHDPSDSMGMINHTIKPMISTRVNEEMQEIMKSAGNLCANHGDNSIKKERFEMGGCANWQENIRISANQRQLNESKDVISPQDKYVRHGRVYNEGIKYDDDPGLLSYNEEALHDDQKEKDLSTSRQPLVNASGTDHNSRKRPADAAHLPSLSSSYSKRAHLVGSVCATTRNSSCTTTTTTSTTTRSTKSSSRNPQGPALNTNGKPRAPQGCANDPQSVAARNRRERINARLKVLQELVPNGSKVDLVTMLEKAINYVKFLQLQLRVLSNDDFWQANQGNVEQATTGSEEGYSTHINGACESVMACSDREDQYNYMCDKIYNA